MLHPPGRRVPCVRERKIASTRRCLTSAAIPSRVTHCLSSSVVGSRPWRTPRRCACTCVHVRNVKAPRVQPLFFRSVHRRRCRGRAPLTSPAIIRSRIHLTYHATLDEGYTIYTTLDPNSPRTSKYIMRSDIENSIRYKNFQDIASRVSQ